MQKRDKAKQAKHKYEYERYAHILIDEKFVVNDPSVTLTRSCPYPWLGSVV